VEPGFEIGDYTVKKIKLYPYSRDSQPVPVDADRILCNDVVFQGDPGAGNTKLWLCASLYGPMGAVWASNEEEALNELVDQGLADAILVDENNTHLEEEQITHLGNHGMPCDLSNVGCAPVIFIPERDWRLLCKFAEARGAGHDNLDF
jgi:hypothetical protein